MILNGEESFFQSNPFEKPVECGRFLLNFYQESIYSVNFAHMHIDDKITWNAMKFMFGMDEELHLTLKDKLALNPDVFFGHQRLIQQLMKELIDLIDDFDCMFDGCDFAAVNYIWYKELSESGSPISVSLKSRPQGTHLINPTIRASRQFLIKRKLFDPVENLYLNYDGKPSPVVINYLFNTRLSRKTFAKLGPLLKEFPFV